MRRCALILVAALAGCQVETEGLPGTGWYAEATVRCDDGEYTLPANEPVEVAGWSCEVQAPGTTPSGGTHVYAVCTKGEERVDPWVTCNDRYRTSQGGVELRDDEGTCLLALLSWWQRQ